MITCTSQSIQRALPWITWFLSWNRMVNLLTGTSMESLEWDNLMLRGHTAFQSLNFL